MTSRWNITLVAALLLLLTACTQEKSGFVAPTVTAPVVPSSGVTDEVLGTGDAGYHALNERALEQGILSGRIERSRATCLSGSEDCRADKEALLLGFPKDLLGEQQVFGAVITAVTDTENEDLGGLKLTDLTPTHVVTQVGLDTSGKEVLKLMGCSEKCEEGSELKEVAKFPILGEDKINHQLILDLSAVADELNLIKTLDPDGEYTQLTTKEAKTVSLDYSLSTLIFDVRVSMLPKEVKPGTREKTTDFTVRWYLRLSSKFDPGFLARSATPGVGFFMTERSVAPKIQRFRVSGLNGKNQVHYFLKNIPAKYQPAFASAFEEWNQTFLKVIGRRLLSYEFVSEADPRHALLVTGDPRYNIVEWDLVNKAPYGGLGPNIANQFTGEVLTANILIQGPTILDIYTKWFQASGKARELESRGQSLAAQNVLKTEMKNIDRLVSKLERGKFGVSLGDSLPLRVTSELPALEDPLFQREDFDPIPANYDFDTYMYGYFHDMVSHELGHNLGLRHNFVGNLYAEPGEPQEGKVSHSIMEYLGRRFRYLDHIGSYDEMAIAYGYKGVEPSIRDRFCTDENVPSATKLDLSAECSRDDATPDPFGFFEKRLERVLSLILADDSTAAPIWKVADMERELKATINNLAIYAATAEKTGASWIRFFTGGDRPSSPAGVKEFVLAKLQGQICGPKVEEALAKKSEAEAKKATEENVLALRSKIKEIVKPFNVFTEEQLGCQVH